MRQLLYVSTTSMGISDETLEAILAVSRANNEKSHITGVLLYLEGGFLQVLEGNDAAVTQTYNRICKDQRHWKAITLLDRAAPRSFGKWSMGFIPKAKHTMVLGSFSLCTDSLKGLVHSTAPAEIITLLRTFYQIHAPAPSVL